MYANSCEVSGLPLKIILDSNFLLVPLQFRVDVFQELERVTNRKVEAVLLHPVYAELKKLSMDGGVKGRRAEMALRYADKLRIVDLEAKPGEAVDDMILRLASEWKCPVATNDRVLRKKLRDLNIAVIYLRKRSHLEVSGNI